MALIDIKLAPAWKRIVETDDETDTAADTPAVEASEARTEPTTVEIEEEVDEPEMPKRRLLTGRRLLALGVVVGGVLAARNIRRTVRRVTVDEKPVDVDIEAGDEQPVEQ